MKIWKTLRNRQNLDTVEEKRTVDVHPNMQYNFTKTCLNVINWRECVLKQRRVDGPGELITHYADVTVKDVDLRPWVRVAVGHTSTMELLLQVAESLSVWKNLFSTVYNRKNMILTKRQETRRSFSLEGNCWKIILKTCILFKVFNNYERPYISLPLRPIRNVTSQWEGGKLMDLW